MPNVRHPLGLPEGSVRGLLALMICAQYWILMVLPPDRRIPVPLYLYFLLALVMMFFVTRSGAPVASDDPASELRPLGIPGVVYRLLLLVVTVGLMSWKYLGEGEGFLNLITPKPEQLQNWATFAIATLAGFTVGLFTRILPLRNSYLFQSVQAWVSLIAMLMLLADLVYQTIIAPGLKQEITTASWEALLVGVIAFYFSSRS